ncbi:MAG: hypothetical protein JRJ87_07905 [Deltaproteobacteria bacterium]|nr:hypothetical protein [Deltaproteobacteria bacterium]
MKTVTNYILAGLVALLPALAAAQDLASDKKQIAFINRTMEKRISTIREQLRADKISLATKNIQGMTESLRELARLTKRIRVKLPGYAPNPPSGCSAGPATSRQNDFGQAKKMAIEAGKQLNHDYDTANQALLKVKQKQIATIAISALKFTIENAPGRQGGKLGDLAVEGVKKLNGFLMDKYVGQPIVGFSEIDLLKGNFVKIKDGEKLMAHLDKSRRKVLDLAHKMDDQAKALASAVTAEKAWQEFAWLCKSGAGKTKVTVIDYRSRDLELTLAGKKIGPESKGQTFTIESEAILTARVVGPRRKFCLERREYAKRTKSIIIHPGPGGGPQDSLVYSSSRIPAKSAWKIKSEKFSWKPSFNSTMVNAPATVSGAYWKLEKDRMRWKIKAKPGQQVNLKVDGKINWRFDSNIRGRRKKKEEKNDGTATLVLKVLK